MAGISSSLTAPAVTNIKITNFDLPLANTEYAFPLSTNCKAIEIAPRGRATLKISFTEGESGTNYKTIHRNTSWDISGFSFSSKTMYIQSNLADEIAEIVELI